MRQLSELDASFLYLESPTSPMHIGGIYLFEKPNKNSAFDFNSFLHFLRNQLSKADFFRSRLVEVPLKLDHPYWVDDPDFDLNKHATSVTLDNPGDEKLLLSLAAKFLAKPLDRNHPLWEVVFVDGLNNQMHFPDNTFALIVKIHQAAVNSITGEELMSTLLSLEPQTADLDIDDWSPKPMPTKARLIGNLYDSALNTPFRLANRAKDTAASVFYSTLVQRLRKLALPTALFNAPSTTINQAIDERREIDYFTCKLEKMRDLKSAHVDFTLNDVVLTICSEVLRGYFEQSDNPITRPLIALMPVSVRSKRMENPTGSQLSAMLISLADNEQNTALRLKRIHSNAVASEVYDQAIAADWLTKLIPSSLLGLSARVYTDFQPAQHYKPLFNIPITNIPGPQTPLFMAEAKLIKQLGVPPLFDGLGLVIVVCSYEGEVTFTVTSCPSATPNLDIFMAQFAKAMKRLEHDLDETDLNAATPNQINESQNDQREKPTSNTSALLGDVLALFNNMFSFSTEEPEVSEKQPADSDSGKSSQEK